LADNQQILKSFQLDNLSIKEKEKDEWGQKIAEMVDGTIGTGISGYYFNRNARIKKNRDWANGRIDVYAKFADRLEFNGKSNYVNIGWQAIQLCNRIMSGLTSRWMNRTEKIEITAVDTLSTFDKREEYDELEFFLYNRERLEQLQQESGVQLLPQEDLPKNKEELDLWQAQFQRLPEEILYELGCNDVLAANGWFSTQKEKILNDSGVAGLVGTYTWMDDEGIIHVDWVKPENMIYSFSEYDDFRDTTWRGQVKAMKVSELRKKYGKEFGGKLTEEQLFQIAETSKDYQLNDKLTWNINWNATFMRPYDEWNVDALDFELRSVDKEPYTVVTTKKNKSTLVLKGKPNKVDVNEQVIEDKKINIYRGVWLRGTKTLLEWGLKKNMIRPQDPKEIGNAEFSYSFYMPQNYMMRNVAIPEKIEEPLEQMILARLKMQQVVARMRPTGAAINWDALQNIDYGLGEKNKEIDVKKLYDQTGDIYYRGLDAEGKQVGVPITELQNTGFIGQMQGLIALYQFHYQVLKDELGEDPNLISQALQPRVTTGNVDVAQQTADNATGHFYRAYLYVMEETAKKVSCLLKDSVTYGAKAYRHLIKEEDIDGRIFSTKAKMLPTEQEIAILDNKMNQAIASNPDLVMYLDTFKIIRIAKEDVKLAEQYYNNAMKKMLESRIQQQQDNLNTTIKGQQDSAKITEQEKRKSLALELQVKGAISDKESSNQMKVAIVTQILALRAKGLPIPPEWASVEKEIVQNVGIPLFAENVNTLNQLAESLKEEEGEEEQQEMMENESQSQEMAA